MDEECVVLDGQLQIGRHLVLDAGGFHLARAGSLHDTMEANPDLRDRLAITTPAALRTAVWEAGARRRLADCVNALFERRPKVSARIVFWGNQGFYCGVFISMLCVLLTADHGMAILHAALSLSYLAVLMLRLDDWW